MGRLTLNILLSFAQFSIDWQEQRVAFGFSAVASL